MRLTGLNSYTNLGYIYYTNIYGVVIGNSGAGNYAATINGNLEVIGTVYQSSDRNMKDRFTPVDEQGILEQVACLPISNWNFKADATTRHIGPMAQDFYAAFNVGTDDKHIATIDESGVALAAIQGLNQKVTKQAAQMKEKDAQIEALNKRLADLEQLVKSNAQK
jgi:Chaperone of endosialidase